MIKNYTSTVPANRSISYIENRLVKHGARDIVKRYGPSGELSELCFSIETQKRRIAFKLPARVYRVEKVLMGEVRRPNINTEKRVKAQAERTAWKLLSDWIDIQLSLIELGQTEILEVFLPYVYDAAKGQTFFERMKEGGYRLLSAPREGRVE